MTVLSHRFSCGRPDGPDQTKIRPSNWNDGHVFAGSVNGAYLTRDTSDTTYGGAWRIGALVYNVKDYGALGDGTTDDAAAIRAAVAAVPAAGGTVYVPAGTYRVRSKITLPSYVWLRGDGRGSTIKITDITKAGGTNGGDFDAFEIAAGTVFVRISTMRFVGENNPYVTYGNNASAAIGIRGITNTDVSIEDCSFEDLIGFPIHAESGGLRCLVARNRMINCANGLNVNGDYTVQVDNYLHNCESIECSGDYALIARNTIINANPGGTAAAISVGGLTSAGANNPGIQVVGNFILASGGKGIGVSDGVQDSLIAHNIIIKAQKNGIQLVSDGYNDIARVDVIGNRIIDAGLSTEDAASRTGIYCPSNTDGRILNNYVSTGIYAGYSTYNALLLRAPGVMLGGNYFNGATLDASITTGAIGTILLPNTFVNKTQQVTSTATLIPPVGFAVNTTDVVDSLRLWSESAGLGRERYARLGDGTLVWGDGANLRDTNLYRSAANVLKTDDHFIGTLSVRSTAVAFASLPSSPVEGMMVPVTNSTTATFGATISGGGANHVLAYYNGTNWTVAGA